MLSHVAALPEIWQEIAYYLDQSDLAHLTRVSREFSLITEKYLYRRITWQWDHSRPDNAAPIHQLLLNILRRSELALYVQELRVIEIGYGPKPRLLTATPISSQDQDVALSLLQEAGIPLPRDWITRLCDFEAETIVALILLQLPSIQTLVVDMFHRDDGYNSPVPNFSPIGDVLRLRATKLERLTEVHWPSKDFDCHSQLIRRGELLDMLPILRAPQLEKASLKLSSPTPSADSNSINEWLPTPRWSPKFLTSLCLQYTTVSEAFLMQLLANMEKLEVFRLDLYQQDNDIIFDGPLIRQALEPCRKVLRHLTLRWEACGEMHSSTNSTPLGSLKGFPVLEYVDATISALVMDEMRLEDILPCTLRGLVLRQGPLEFFQRWEDGMQSAWEDFLIAYRVSLPCLTTVQIGLWEMPVGVKDLEERCLQEHGLHVSFFEV